MTGLVTSTIEQPASIPGRRLPLFRKEPHSAWAGTKPPFSHISLIVLVGAGRFERPTPCAQGGFRQRREMLCFQPAYFNKMRRRH
jgi:hypothetical protein